MKLRIGFGLITVLGLCLPDLASAAPTPQLYPNQHYHKVGAAQAQYDINACQVRAQDFVASHSKGNSAGRDAVRSGAKGAALGALGASIMGNSAGRGAGAGAAIGGLSSLHSSRKEQREGSPELRSYMEACLEDKGYKVAGWG